MEGTSGGKYLRGIDRNINTQYRYKIIRIIFYNNIISLKKKIVKNSSINSCFFKTIIMIRILPLSFPRSPSFPSGGLPNNILVNNALTYHRY